MSISALKQLRFVAVGQNDPLAAPLLTQLAAEYAKRYRGDVDKILAWLLSYPAEEFAPPGGGVLIGVLDGQPVTGGAFRRFDSATAELKRIWTDTTHRRHGHARTLLVALEDEIIARGYRRIYLTTGDRQPEAEALYLATGYARLDVLLPAEGEVYPVAFLKQLS